MHANPPGPRPRDGALAVVLAIGVTLYDVWLLSSPAAQYFATDGAAPVLLVVLRRTGGVLAVLAAQAAFFWASFASPRLVRISAVVLFAVVTLLEYGFVAGAGGVMNAQDVPMALQSVKYWPAMIRAFVDWRALVPMAAYAAALWWRPRAPAPGWIRRWAAALALAVLAHGAYAIAHLERVEFGDVVAVAPPMAGFQSFFRTIAIAASDAAAEARQPYRRQPVGFSAVDTPRHHVLLVIDESMSASHFSLNGYSRATTPWLDELGREGRLTLWGDAAAATVYSNSSFLSMMTGFNAFPDLEHRVSTLPTIFQFAKAMNYRTHLLDGQITGRRFGFTPDDMRFVDDWQTASAFGDDPDTDTRVARAAARILDEPAGQFVVVLKRGNHAPHETNFPSDAARWQPSGNVPYSQDPTVLKNTYDNAIRYNVDAFFRALLRPDGSLPRTVGLYTSDHGEELGDEGTPFVRKLVPQVIAVPLFMFGDDRPSVDTRYPASHHNLFATLLDLMHVPASARPWPYGRSLLTARATDHDPRPVLSGYMFGGSYYHEVKEFDVLRGSHPLALSGAR